MNYKHDYHAGNFTEVLKHTLLIALFSHLQNKDKPFCFIESHAGAGIYALDSISAQKTMEYANGVEKIFSAPVLVHPWLVKYKEDVKKYNATDALQYYPGSPFFAENNMRACDRMVLCELHPQVYDTLKGNFRSLKRAAVHHIDGYKGIRAFAPPTENRGLVLIDPPFESIDEFKHIIESVNYLSHHWRNGQVMIWYPIKSSFKVNKFYQQINRLNDNLLTIELSLKETCDNKMHACGVIVINPPWKLEEELRLLIPELSRLLNANIRTSPNGDVSKLI